MDVFLVLQGALSIQSEISPSHDLPMAPNVKQQLCPITLTVQHVPIASHISHMPASPFGHPMASHVTLTLLHCFHPVSLSSCVIAIEVENSLCNFYLK